MKGERERKRERERERVVVRKRVRRLRRGPPFWRPTPSPLHVSLAGLDRRRTRPRQRWRRRRCQGKVWWCLCVSACMATTTTLAAQSAEQLPCSSSK
jgi:hypothetical protein